MLSWNWKIRSCKTIWEKQQLNIDQYSEPCTKGCSPPSPPSRTPMVLMWLERELGWNSLDSLTWPPAGLFGRYWSVAPPPGAVCGGGTFPLSALIIIYRRWLLARLIFKPWSNHWLKCGPSWSNRKSYGANARVYEIKALRTITYHLIIVTRSYDSHARHAKQSVNLYFI